MGKLTLAIALSAFLDAGTTCWGFSRGFEEGNPLLSPIVGTSCGKMIGVKAAATGGQLFLLSRLHKKHPKLAKWLRVGIVVTNSGASIHNTIIIGRD